MHLSHKKPVIAVPMGDPSGIGPEIIVKALTDPELAELCKPVVFGEPAVFEAIQSLCGTSLPLRIVKSPSDPAYEPGALNIVPSERTLTGYESTWPPMEGLVPTPGVVSPWSGAMAHGAIIKAVEYAKSGEVDALATTPINKEAIKAAGIPCIGHTELLGELTGSPDPLTLFQVFGLRIFFLTRHVSLRKACDLVTRERLFDYIPRCLHELTALGLKSPFMAIAGLNPHSSDNGLFGDEENAIIKPALEELKRKGYNITGPVPADCVFHQALNGKYDAVLSLYHDQGHIASKMVDFERTISLTLGLPFLRTSVDHGTAFDIAGKNSASSVSMTEAIRVAAEYCLRRTEVGYPPLATLAIRF